VKKTLGSRWGQKNLHPVVAPFCANREEVGKEQETAVKGRGGNRKIPEGGGCQLIFRILSATKKTHRENARGGRVIGKGKERIEA